MKLFNQKSSTIQPNSRSPLSEVFFELLDPKPEFAKSRFIFLISLFCMFWIILIISSTPTLNSFGRFATDVKNDSLPFYNLVVNYIFAPQIMMRLFVCVIAFIITSLLASQYLKIVHQLPKAKTALNLLLSLSFGMPISGFVKIDEGKISNISKDSHINYFGGPGKIKVSFDSAAILENPEGEVEIVGPTAKLQKGFFLLKPYQRIQRVIDLRNQTISFDLLARTQDGIAIWINKIQLTFSVLRSSKKVTLTRPYSFSVKDLHNLVYGQPDREFCELVTDYAKTIILELFRNLNYEDLFLYKRIIDSQSEKYNHPFILGNKKKSFQNSLTRKAKKSIEFPKKSIASQQYLWRPILHKPHQNYNELINYKANPISSDLPARHQLNLLLADHFEHEFSIHPGHPEVNLERINMGIWSPAYPLSINKNSALLRSPSSYSSKFFSGNSTDFSNNIYFNVRNQIPTSENDGNVKSLIEILNLLKERAKGMQNNPKVNLDNLNSAIKKLERIINESLPCKN